MKTGTSAEVDRTSLVNGGGGVRGEGGPSSITIPVGTPLHVVKRTLMTAALANTRGNVTRAARLLGVDPKTLWRWLREREDEAAVAATQREDVRNA